MGFLLLSWRDDVVRVQVGREWCLARSVFVSVSGCAVLRRVLSRGVVDGEAERAGVSRA